jgi:hypothetical protein
MVLQESVSAMLRLPQAVLLSEPAEALSLGHGAGGLSRIAPDHLRFVEEAA